MIVINRTSKRLEVVCNGNSHFLEPGENDVPPWLVRFAVSQHPRLGSFDNTNVGESLIYVPGRSPADHAGMIPPGQEHLGNERIDRAAFPLPPSVLGYENVKLPPARQVLERAHDMTNIMITRD